MAGIKLLRVDHQVRPLAASRRPTFSWVSEGAGQSIHRVRLFRGDTPQWDSGDRVLKDSWLVYDGPELQPGASYGWSVEVTDRLGQATLSEPHTFTTALDTFPTLGEWIAAPDYAGTVEPILSHELIIERPVVSARWYVCALGLGQLTIDGKPVHDHRLSTPLTNFDRTVTYLPIDVTQLLGVGPHRLEIALGRGFFALPTENVWHWQRPSWTGRLRTVAELHLVYADGSQEIIGTGPDWQAQQGKTQFDCLYAGESFDATAEPGAPVASEVVEAPKGALRPLVHEPVRVTWSGRPQWTQHGDSWVADFGRTMAGWATLRTSQARGARVQLTYAEFAEADGTLKPRNQHVTGDRFQRDDYIGNGEAEQSWEPRYTYKGFRYVQVDGLTHPPDEQTLTAHLAHNDVAEVGSLVSSEPLFERYQLAMTRTILNNLHHLPTDTPMYEKNGWTGDARVALETMLGLLDLRQVLTKWAGDLRDAQLADGALPVIAPTAGWGFAELAPSPEWTTLYPHMLRELYRHYADRELLAEHWDSLVLYLDWELGKLVDGVAVSALGDFLQPGTPGVGQDDAGVTATSFLIKGLQSAAEIAVLLHHDQEGRRFTEAADRLTEAMNDRYLSADRTHYAVGERYSQTSNAVPLVFGLVPDDAIGAVAKNLAEDVIARGHHHNIGCIGAQTLLRALTDHGFGEQALTVARQDSYPSWGFWFANGADTMWEMWETTARSRNHYFHGTVVQWLIEDLAGLRCGDHGWRTFEVRPQPLGDLTQMGHAVDTIRGRASSHWTRRGTDFRLEVEVPFGATATVTVPGGHVAVEGAALTASDGSNAFQAPAGRWVFTATLE